MAGTKGLENIAMRIVGDQDETGLLNTNRTMLILSEPLLIEEVDQTIYRAWPLNVNGGTHVGFLVGDIQLPIPKILERTIDRRIDFHIYPASQPGFWTVKHHYRWCDSNADCHYHRHEQTTLSPAGGTFQLCVDCGRPGACCTIEHHVKYMFSIHKQGYVDQGFSWEGLPTHVWEEILSYLTGNQFLCSFMPGMPEVANDVARHVHWQKLDPIDRRPWDELRLLQIAEIKGLVNAPIPVKPPVEGFIKDRWLSLATSPRLRCVHIWKPEDLEGLSLGKGIKHIHFNITPRSHQQHIAKVSIPQSCEEISYVELKETLAPGMAAPVTGLNMVQRGNQFFQLFPKVTKFNLRAKFDPGFWMDTLESPEAVETISKITNMGMVVEHPTQVPSFEQFRSMRVLILEVVEPWRDLFWHIFLAYANLPSTLRILMILGVKGTARAMNISKWEIIAQQTPNLTYLQLRFTNYISLARLQSFANEIHPLWNDVQIVVTSPPPPFHQMD